MRYADRGITSTTRIFAGDRSRGVGTFLPLLNNEDVLDEFTIVGATTVSFDFEESDAKLGEPDSASSLDLASSASNDACRASSCVFGWGDRGGRLLVDRAEERHAFEFGQGDQEPA